MNNGPVYYASFQKKSIFVEVLPYSHFLLEKSLECKPIYCFVFCSSASDRILRSYKRSLNGFAAKLSEEEAHKLSGLH
jgi:hypothetical protein